MSHPTSAQHRRLPDGRVEVTYGDGVVAVYDSSRAASIESLMRLFPGTSREWLESMHSR